MRNFARTTAVALGGTALVGVAATAAFAAGAPYTVSVGGSTATGTHNITFASQEPAGGGANDPDIGFNVPLLDMTCTTASGAGTVKSGQEAAGNTGGVSNPIATISTMAFSGCLGPLDLPMGVTKKGTWNVNITGGGPSLWTGTITGVSADVYDTQGTPGALCDFDVNGSVSGTFNESGQLLSITGSSLTVSSVTGCFSLINNGDPATFLGAFAISSPDGAIDISDLY